MMKNQRKRSHPLRMSMSPLAPNGRPVCLIWFRDIQVLKTYGAAPYAAALKRLEKEIKEKQTSVNEKIGLFSKPPIQVCDD